MLMPEHANDSTCGKQYMLSPLHVEASTCWVKYMLLPVHIEASTCWSQYLLRPVHVEASTCWGQYFLRTISFEASTCWVHHMLRLITKHNKSTKFIRHKQKKGKQKQQKTYNSEDFLSVDASWVDVLHAMFGLTFYWRPPIRIYVLVQYILYNVIEHKFSYESTTASTAATTHGRKWTTACVG